MSARQSLKGKPDYTAKASQVTKNFLDSLESQFRSEQLEKVYELHGKIADVVRPYRLETIIAALRIVEQQVIQAELEKQPKEAESKQGSQAAIA